MSRRLAIVAVAVLALAAGCASEGGADSIPPLPGRPPDRAPAVLPPLPPGPPRDVCSDVLTERVTLADAIEAARVVVVGRVTAIGANEAAGAIPVFRTRVAVERVLHGRSPPTIDVTQMACDVSAFAAAGRRYLFLLEPRTFGGRLHARHVPVGYAQGVLPLAADGRSARGRYGLLDLAELARK